MTSTDDYRPRGPHGTDIGALRAVQEAVTRLIRRKWSGWSTADRLDLESLVLEKYFIAFGRDRLPDGPDGRPRVPIAWLSKVVANTGVDVFRREQVRPADPFDFGNPDDPDVDARLFNAVNGRQRLSAVVADRVDLQRALRALGDAYPTDLDMIRWRLVEDRTFADIAVLSGKSEDAAKKSVQRAMQRLRDLIQNVPAVDVNQRAVHRRIARREP